MIPEWLEPIRAATGTITAGDLSRYAPPPGTTPRRGAVLLLFGEGPDGPDLLLTERAHHMRSHPGQVSFPGGALDPEDADAAAGALREAGEETGLDPTGVDVIGELPRVWLPPSNFSVTPVLGWWRRQSAVTVVDPDEVHAVFRVAVDRLLDPAHRVTTVHPRGFAAPGFLLADGLLLWGFTAGIVSRLFDHVGWTRPWDARRTYPIEDWMIHGRSGTSPLDGDDISELPSPDGEIR